MRKERITESLFEEEFKKKNINHKYRLEYQGSQIEDIKKLLSKSSKNGKGNIGSPEFIITSEKYLNYVIVVECKKDTNFHKSKNLDNAVDYSVDGVLHYGKFLSKSYNVICIAISGTDLNDFKIDNFFYEKGNEEFLPLVDKHGLNVNSILSFDDYLDLIMYDKDLELQREKDLLKFSKDLHNFMYSHAKLTEEQKPLLVSGTLIALQKQSFLLNYDTYLIDELPEQWLNSIKYQLKQSNINEKKVDNMIKVYSQIKDHPEMIKSSNEHPNGILKSLISMIKDNLMPLVKKQNNIDVMGQFYGEFLKYTAGDGKGLGIVLTPKHITELFCDLVDLKPTDKVLDIRTGTGGFLISSMDYMIKKAIKQNTEEKDRIETIKNIKQNGLVGVEQQPNMFTLASSNMILRGDGKSNLYQGSCFDEEIVKEIKKHKCNVGFINPPYSQKDFSELDFINHMLNCLDVGGIGIAIVPMSCGIDSKNKKIKEKILEKHTLKATMSMPENLFYPVGVNTIIMVFEAHKPHNNENETWFGYWKDDGFKVLNKQGRINLFWEEIKKVWIKSFKTNKVEPSKSSFEIVGRDDEWCCETYLETDYKLIKKDFEDEMKKFLSFKFLYNSLFKDFILVSIEPFNISSFTNIDNFQNYKINDIFNIHKGVRHNQSDRIYGKIPFITSSSNNNGVSNFISKENINMKIQENKITVDMFNNVFYQPYEFLCDDNVHVLTLKNKELNPYISFFLVCMLKQDKYRYAFGRQLRLKNFTKQKISLPSKQNSITKEYEPDWEYMEEYIKSLPYSKHL